MLDQDKARDSLRQGGFSAWLLCNVFHRDEIADQVLSVEPEKKNTRPWVCLLYPDRPPLKIVHRIEASILEHVPGETLPYYTREEFRSALRGALPGSGRVAADYSPSIPVGSFLDHGTALLLRSLGADLCPAESLVARYLGGLDEAGRASHEAAARVLLSAVEDAWARLGASAARGDELSEGEVSGWIARALANAGLVSDAPPVVAAGRNTADPHYGPQGRGAVLAPGDVVQFDVWARSPAPGCVYADISWVGVLAPAPSAGQAGVFAAIREAREAVIGLIGSRLASGQKVTGADADRAARAVLVRHGFEQSIRHRTGHSIGGRVHGYGVHLDSVEFPDERGLEDGACFSVEPGVYLPEFGMRTEVNCMVHGGRLLVTSGKRQDDLLTGRG